MTGNRRKGRVVDLCGRRAGARFGEMMLRDQRTGAMRPLTSIDFRLPDNPAWGETEPDLDLITAFRSRDH